MTRPSTVRLGFVLLLTLSALCLAQSTPFEISWYSATSNGAGESAGGDFTVEGSAGGTPAGEAAGGDFTVVGGFWPAIEGTEIFSDGFESGDISSWSAALGSL